MTNTAAGIKELALEIQKNPAFLTRFILSIGQLAREKASREAGLSA